MAAILGILACHGAQVGYAQSPNIDLSKLPWMDVTLSPDQRADLVLKELTLDDKISLIHGQGQANDKPVTDLSVANGADGSVLGVPRLGIPMLQMAGSSYGVTTNALNGRYSTALPSDIALASTWDNASACRYGTLLGRELHAQGYNVSLGGGVNLARELRNGRTFEYQGEDPILAGTLIGNRVRCEQEQHVISVLKHFALNDQETGRSENNSILNNRAFRETDLLAFEIGNSIARPGAIMCSYNAVNGDFACENKTLLSHILKEEWGFSGFVISDWGATHSVAKASSAGLDMEQPSEAFYGNPMKQAVLDGTVPLSELNEHVHRILRAEFASGIVDRGFPRSVPDLEAGYKTSREIAEKSIVLLKNEKNILPLNRANKQTIAVIGLHADTSMISGGGSAQVDPPGAAIHKWMEQVWYPTSPLDSITSKAGAKVSFISGTDSVAAAALAAKSEIAIVFAYQWTSEEMDLTSLTLPDHQDNLIESVAAANPNTIVVLETGTAVTMPWVDRVPGVVEVWYAGNKGADAVANMLFGEVNPSAKLPITFPISDNDLPPPGIVVPPAGDHSIYHPKRTPTFNIHYVAGLNVGYKWYDSQAIRVLFPFGFGLSYTTFKYSNLRLIQNGSLKAVFSVTNSGQRAGDEIAEVYVSLPDDAVEPPKRLVAWSRFGLAAGETKEVSIPIDSKFLSIFDDTVDKWKLLHGDYRFFVGGSSQDLPLKQTVKLPQ